MAYGIDPLLGVTLGGTYRVVQKLGEGGMGAVYLVEHLRLPRPFALKILHDADNPDPQYYHRFRREAEVCSRLRHENIVEVVDFNVTESGQPYLVMDYLEGEDLSGRLNRERCLSVPDTARILGQICSALTEAHEQGVVHRDLKPQNIFLVRRRAREDTVKLLDFGISKIQTSRSMLTGTNAMLGTPAYMSPEQTGAGTGEVTYLSDLFSLGVIAYQMLTGNLPFEGDNLAKIVLSIIMKTPDPMRAFRNDVPPAVEAAVFRLLEKDPTQRFQSAWEFNDAFQQAALGAPSSPHVVGPELARAGASPPVTGDDRPRPVPTGPALRSGPVPRPQLTAQGLGPEALVPEHSPPSAMPVEPAGRGLDPQTTLGSAASELGTRRAPGKPRRARRPWWLGAAAGAGGVALVAVLAVVISQRFAAKPAPGQKTAAERPGPNATVGAVTPDAGASPTVRALAPTRVTVRLKGRPAPARCRIDDRPVPGDQLELAASSQTARLTCAAKGFVPFSRDLVPDRDQELEVAMRAESRDRPGRPSAREVAAPPSRRTPPPDMRPTPPPERERERPRPRPQVDDEVPIQ